MKFSKKIYAKRALLAGLLAFVMVFPLISCVDRDNGTTTTAATTTAATTTLGDPSQNKPEGGEPEADEKVLDSEPPKSLKILAIGNSFSTDSMQYLYQIAKNAGVEEIVLGNLYYGGCSLDEHYAYGTNDITSYTYYKNTTGTWGSTKNYKMSDAVKDEDWDYISL